MHQMRHGVQVVKYLTTGLITNSGCYLVYVLLTMSGLGHKTAMTLLFGAGVLISYRMNKRWTFSCLDTQSTTLLYFVAVYATAYILNLGSIWVAVDCMGMSHYLVQAVTAAVLAALLFIAQKYWIFVKQAKKVIQDPFK